MKEMPANKKDAGGKPRSYRPIYAWIATALVVFGAGAALSAYWFSPKSLPAVPVANETAAAPEVALSAATKGVLKGLEGPIEIRFYSSLDSSSVPDSVQAFALRVDQLLASYEKAGGARIKVTRHNTATNFDANAALADGIKAFNIDKGDGCYLGLAVVADGQRQTLAQLAPEWEQALEPDLTRAIAQAAEAKAAVRPVTRTDTATFDAVKRSLPNYDAMSLEDGTQAIRNAALAQFKEASDAIAAQVESAQQHFIQAQNDRSEAGQRAATEELQAIQAEGMDKLKQIALNSRAQIAALQQLKKSAP